MDQGGAGKQRELTGLLIAPDRALAAKFAATLPDSRAFQIVADLKSYPTQHVLELRLRQIGPDVILLDLGSDRTQAGDVIRFAAALKPPVHVVGLSRQNDPELLLSSLRLGASEFLYAPFATEAQMEAVGRLLRIRQPDLASIGQPGTIVMFTSAKPGSGASTLAFQVAFALRRLTEKATLLADFDLTGGSVCFSSKLTSGSICESFRDPGHISPSKWCSLVSEIDGVDVLAGPEAPCEGTVEPGQIAALLDYARSQYEWVVLDLPAVFRSFSLTALSHADVALLVSTCELPSLHFARKALKLVEQLGFPKERFAVVLNRVSRREDLRRAEIEKVVQCPVYAKFPNDYFSLHRAVTLGKPLDRTCELGRSLEELAYRLSSTTGFGAVDRISSKVATN